MSVPYFQVNICTVKSSMRIYFHIFLLVTWSCCNTHVKGESEVIGSSQDVVAKVGDDVILPCHIEPPVSMAKGSVQWSRPDLEPDIVHIWTDGYTISGVKTLNPMYKRTSLFHEELPHGNISLKLSCVQLADEGTFKCSVPKLGKSSSIKLIVEDGTGLTGVIALTAGITVIIILVVELLIYLCYKMCRPAGETGNNQEAIALNEPPRCEEMNGLMDTSTQPAALPDGPNQTNIDHYKLTSKPTGLCLIISNENFEKPGLEHRVGTDKEADKVARTFSMLGFRVLMCKDQTRDQMKTTLECFSSLKNLTELQKSNVREWSRKQREFTYLRREDPLQHGDAFVCCVMSHAEDGVFGTDGETLHTGDITWHFNGENCTVLKSKPKVFFIEGYQSKWHQNEADFLVAMSTSKDFWNYTGPETGSFFMHSVCEKLEEECHSGDDLMTILDEVIKMVSQWRPDDGTPQIPDVKQNTLMKKLVFSPSNSD